jgi:hypothetical protein
MPCRSPAIAGDDAVGGDLADAPVLLVDDVDVAGVVVGGVVDLA